MSPFPCRWSLQRLLINLRLRKAPLKPIGGQHFLIPNPAISSLPLWIALQIGLWIDYTLDYSYYCPQDCPPNWDCHFAWDCPLDRPVPNFLRLRFPASY